MIFAYLTSTYYKIKHKKTSISNYGNTRFLIFRSVFCFASFVSINAWLQILQMQLGELPQLHQ
ncbi:hypothetical protein ACLVQ1_09820, partial [Streptococcus pneumoniae]